MRGDKAGAPSVDWVPRLCVASISAASTMLGLSGLVNADEPLLRDVGLMFFFVPCVAWGVVLAKALVPEAERLSAFLYTVGSLGGLIIGFTTRPSRLWYPAGPGLAWVCVWVLAGALLGAAPSWDAETREVLIKPSSSRRATALVSLLALGVCSGRWLELGAGCFAWVVGGWVIVTLWVVARLARWVARLARWAWRRLRQAIGLADTTQAGSASDQGPDDATPAALHRGIHR